MELLWRDGRVDDSVGAPPLPQPAHVLQALTRQRRAGEPALLAAFRESLQLNFGDAALGAALASLQGTATRAHAHNMRRLLTLRVRSHACPRAR